MGKNRFNESHFYIHTIMKGVRMQSTTFLFTIFCFDSNNIERINWNKSTVKPKKMQSSRYIIFSPQGLERKGFRHLMPVASPLIPTVPAAVLNHPFQFRMFFSLIALSCTCKPPHSPPFLLMHWIFNIDGPPHKTGGKHLQDFSPGIISIFPLQILSLVFRRFGI